jgi:spermidine synthase
MSGDRPEVVDRRDTPRGELVLRRAGDHHEVIANGTFLMDTRDGRSERALVREAIAGLADARVLIAGLGVGFSLDEALRSQATRQVVVVEVEAAVIEWAGTHLREVTGAALEDPRVTVVLGDVVDVLEELGGLFDAVCVDVDNGPGWLVHSGNAALYDDRGVERLGQLLRPDGRLAVWAAAPDSAFEDRLRRHFAVVRTVHTAVARGPDDVVYLAERPRAM